MLSSRSSILCFMFRSKISFELTFIQEVRFDQDSFFFAYGCLLQNCLLKRPTFLHWTAFIPLWIIIDQGGVASRALAQWRRPGSQDGAVTTADPKPSPGHPERSHKQWEPALLWPHQNTAGPRTHGALGARRELKPDWWCPSSLCPSESHSSSFCFFGHVEQHAAP